SPGDWGLVFESPSYRDVMTMANARFLNAQASLMERGQAGAATTTSVQVGGATFALGGTKVGEGAWGRGGDGAKESTCSCGSKHSAFRNPHAAFEATKELTRPRPWPALDKLETEYENRLKSDWLNLKVKCFDILGLKIPEASPASALSASSAVKSPKVSSVSPRLRGEKKGFE